MSNPLILVFIAVCFSVTGEFLLKAGMNRVGVFSLISIGAAFPRMITTWQLWAGFGLIGIGAFFWLSAISRADLSWAYPLLAVGYILTLLFAPLVLREHIPLIRWMGTILIVIGIYLISRS
ncbi:MAG: EamA family transporter [Candidatus Eisenbacteria sp.]|nr:EamA family transporter [Candidatus Eisenbacteria bacterium]